jgi:hypothetical protein
MTDQSRHFGSLFDSANQGETARSIQKAELDSKKDYMPTVEGCRFDTMVPHRSAAMRVAKYMDNALGTEVDAALGSKAKIPVYDGSTVPGIKSNADLIQKRFGLYNTKYCDDQANAGKAACNSGQSAYKKAAVLPSLTLFGRETIDTTEDSARIEQLVYNLTDPQPRDHFDKKLLQASAGEKEKRNRDLAYMARMSAAAAPLSQIISERTPGSTEATDLVAERMLTGAFTGLTGQIRMSEKEIQQTAIEQLWDPNYYVNLTDVGPTVVQKENYLRAYNAMLMYKLLQKTERIALIYAVQTANMLEAYDTGKGQTSDMAPKRSQ